MFVRERNQKGSGHGKPSYEESPSALCLMISLNGMVGLLDVIGIEKVIHKIRIILIDDFHLVTPRVIDIPRHRPLHLHFKKIIYNIQY